MRGDPLLLQLIDSVIDGVPESQHASYASALATLADRTPEELELRLRETLGLASHRLDGWITGLAARALDAKRRAGGGALRIGGFGWVEKLVPDESARASRRDSSTRPRWSTPPPPRCCVPAGRPTARTTPPRRWP